MLLLRYSTAVICAVFFATGAVSGEVKIKPVGDTVFFRPANINPGVTSIIWKHRSSSGVVVKAIEWDDDGFNIPNPRFKNITSLDEKTGQITITNLTVEHSGDYTIDINSKEQEQRFTLKVQERVSKPVIVIEESSNPNVVYLRCGNSEEIIWKNSAGQVLEGKKNHKPGKFIMVENTKNPKNFYTCTLKNDVSEETSQVYESDLFKTESNVGLIVGIVIGVLVSVIGIISLYACVKPVHDPVNKFCPCIPNFFGPLDCILKRIEGEPKVTTVYDVVKSENADTENASPEDEKQQ